MMNPNLQNQIENQRYEEMVRYAQNQQMAQELTSGNKQANSGMVRPALASLGKVLSEVGDHLQERYGTHANEDAPAVGNYQLETAK